MFLILFRSGDSGCGLCRCHQQWRNSLFGECSDNSGPAGELSSHAEGSWSLKWAEGPATEPPHRHAPGADGGARSLWEGSHCSIHEALFQGWKSGLPEEAPGTVFSICPFQFMPFWNDVWNCIYLSYSVSPIQDKVAQILMGERILKDHISFSFEPWGFCSRSNRSVKHSFLL